MGLLGDGRGFLGLRKSFNGLLFLDLVFLIIVGGYFYFNKQYTLIFGVIAIFLVILAYLSGSSRRRN